MESNLRHDLARIIFTDMSGVEQTISIDSNYPLVTIGRAVDCDIRSNRKSVSRHHAEFKFANNQVQVIDLNSSNGTFLIVDDQRRAIIGQQTIAANDEVWCGDFVLRYVVDNVVPDQRPPIPTFTSAPDLSFSTHPTDRPLSGSQPLEPALSPPPPQFGGPNNPPPSLVVQGGLDPLTDDINEIERLLAEKSSIEDLASRQSLEIDRLESLIGSVKEDALALQSQRDETEAEKERLKKQLEAQKADNVVIDLENEVVELRAMNDKLRLEISQAGDDITNSFEIQLDKKDAEIDELGQENEKLGNLNDDVSGQLKDAKAETQNLKSQLELLNEKLTSHDESQKVDAERESKLAAKGREANTLRIANDALAAQSEDQNVQILDLHVQISDLNDKILQVEREKETLNANLQANEAEASNEELLTFLTSLERLTDAIQRTDFSVLSTVDRVRLQSAIRETKPKATLQAFIEKNK